MIRHTVVFNLAHPQGSAEEQKFLEDALVLTQILGVRHFEQLRQVSPKNDFSFEFSMEFDDQSAYDHYNDHPSTSISSAKDGSRRSPSSWRSTTSGSSRRHDATRHSPCRF